MAAVSKFPLRKLPKKAFQRVLQVMNIEEILAFSLISTACKNQTLSLKLKADNIMVFIENSIRITIDFPRNFMFLGFYTESDTYWQMGRYGRKKKLTAPKSVVIKRGPKWEISDLEMKHWLEHLLVIFGCSAIHSLEVDSNPLDFDIDDIKEIFGRTDRLELKDSGSLDYNQSIFEKFLPIENLSLETNMFPNWRVSPNVLIQNFDDLAFHEYSEVFTNLTLNDLLMVNSKSIYIEFVHVSSKDLNKFIKLWMKGSNRQLEYLSILKFDDYKKDVIMKGIKCQEVPRNQRRVFQSQGEHIVNRRGADIYRCDGTKATVNVNGDSFQMLVWHDHCVGVESC